MLSQDRSPKTLSTKTSSMIINPDNSAADKQAGEEGEYPIRPRDLDTSKMPIGFAHMFSLYSETIMLWGFMEFCKHKGNWGRFTMDEFLAFIDNRNAPMNAPLRSACGTFVEGMIPALFCEHRDTAPNGRNHSYMPSHFTICMYFMHNPIKR